MSSLKLELLNLRKQVLKPSSRLNLVEWAEQNRYLSPESSSTPGKWNTSLVEPARGPMLAFTEPGIKKITIMGPTQLMKTELINNILGFFIHQDPSPILLSMPDGKMLESYSQDRLEPMLRDSPCFHGLIKDKKQKDGGNTRLRKAFPGGHVTLVSAGSATDVSSRPARVVLMDEIDKYTTAGKEGDPVRLLEQRIETFWNSLSVAVCSPTIEGISKIAKRFEESDQRFYHGKCPHCNEYEKLIWHQVKWDNNDFTTARYECSRCNKPWTELDRLEAVRNGIYIATKPFQGHAGFHVNAIASPWKPLSSMVQKFLEVKDNPETLKTFINTSLAETWKVKVETPEWERIFERREGYQIGVVPTKDIKFLTVGADVQGDRIEAQLVGWTKDKQSYTIDYRVFLGQTTTKEPFDELTKFINSGFPVAGTNRHMYVSMTCIDSNFNTQYVYDYVSKFSQMKVRAIKGSDTLQSPWRMGGDLTFNFNGTKRPGGHKLWMVGSSFLKDMLYGNLRLPKLDPTPAYYIHIPQLDEDFCKGLVSEELVLEKGKYIWKKKIVRNESLDTYNYARAAASMYGLDRFRDWEWAGMDGEDVTPPKETQSNNEPVITKPVTPSRFGTPNMGNRNNTQKKRF